MIDYKKIFANDLEIAEAIQLEHERQENNIELIASENIVSKEVMDAMGTILTNKYAEGYPNKRYYGGCEYVDIVETLAIERAKSLFGADCANVQAHSGSQANQAIYNAFLNPGDMILGMNLSHGGHLTHGSPVNMSGKLYKIIDYGVNQEGYIDYDKLEEKAVQNRPKLIIAGASAYSRIIDFERFADIAKKSGAYLMVDMAHIAGLIATGLHPSPVPYADFVTSTTHKTLRGPRGGLILMKAEHEKEVNKSIFPGIQGGPLMHVIASKAICFKEAASNEFKEYTKQVLKNCKTLADELMSCGFEIVSGGTDNHLMLVDLTNMDISGKDAEHRLDAVHITCNKNTVPFETRSPFITSGVRLGTAAVTTRGMNEADMKEIAQIISLVIKDFDNKKAEATQRTLALTAKYPLYK